MRAPWPAVALVSLAVAACVKVSSPAAPASTLVDTAREIVTVHCGACHTPTLPTAMPDALAVFSLADPYWFDRMSDARLHLSVEMVRDRVTATDDEMREMRPGLPPLRPTAAEADAYTRFVDSELARRAAGDPTLR